MSNPLAIAAVTATLRNLLTQGISSDPDLADATVTMQPVDRARPDGTTANQLNVFLYHVLPSPTWRNMDVPPRVRPGEKLGPPLGLNLYYLITAYGRDNDAERPFSHQLLGRAMSILTDHPLLEADEIRAALPNNDLWQQIERVRFTLQPLPQDELSKLWTGFQTGFRLSMAYEAAVVLIESAAAAKTPLPVLARGLGDSGVIAQASMVSPYPILEDLTLPNQAISALPGDTITLVGSQLRADQATVNFVNPHLAAPLTVAATPGVSDTQLTLKIPDAPASWVAGYYTLTVTLSQAGKPERTTNALSLPLAPQITSKMPRKIKRASGNATIALQCKPELLPGQKVALLLGDHEVLAPDLTNQSNKISFVVVNAVAGTFRVRLRVDGVDSPIIDRSKSPPVFDESQQITIE